MTTRNARPVPVSPPPGIGGRPIRPPASPPAGVGRNTPGGVGGGPVQVRSVGMELSNDFSRPSVPPPERGASSEVRTAQQINRQQESYFESSTVGGEVVKAPSTSSYNRSEIEGYLDCSLSSITLAECNLTLEEGVQLRIDWTSPEGKSATSILDLDKFIGNVSGRLVWGHGTSDFSQSCENPSLDGTFLIASCLHNDTYIEDRLDLSSYITYISNPSGGGFGPVDSDFSEFMASPNWMNFTIITQPDMSSFLGHPRFRKAVSGVAHRAVDEAMSNMQYVMQRMAQQMVQQMVDEAMEMVRLRSDLRIEREMDQLVKTAAVNAAYSGINRFTIMQSEARQAYNAFAPHINTPQLSHMNTVAVRDRV
ncbi:hypothetical protein B0H12DRAFT_158644 [Mycena haematopus]|nr:hypothetical protein B0H12DRAFT_158644 [Mycena haematopus]